MTEFNNRISAQRKILIIINKEIWVEELFGLSKGAIDRWVNTNGLQSNLDLVELLREAANKLFFLSNKSQEQITEDYRTLSNEVFEITKKIEKTITNIKSKT